MSEVYDINKDLGRSFLRTGMIILAITLVVFTVNSIKGYTKVHMLKTVDNCKVRTYSGHGTSASTYYTQILRFYEDEDRWLPVYDSKVGYFYYAKMRKYASSRVTFYETSYGEKFPVFKPECNERQAELAFRKLRPPYIWYSLYGIGLAAGLACCWMGSAGKKSANNYKDKTVYETPISFDDM